MTVNMIAVRAMIAQRLPTLPSAMLVHEHGLPGVATYLRRRFGNTRPDQARAHVAIADSHDPLLCAHLQAARQAGMVCIGIAPAGLPMTKLCHYFLPLEADPGIATLLAAFAAAELVFCAATARRPPARLPERLAFAEQLDWSKLSAQLACGVTYLARGPGRGIAEAAAFLHPPVQDQAILAFLQHDATRSGTEAWLADCRARGQLVLAPWAELPAPPPQDPASDLLPQLYAFSRARNSGCGNPSQRNAPASTACPDAPR